MILEEKAAWLLDLISGYFRDHDGDWFATDIGDFQITITTSGHLSLIGSSLEIY